jgi:hypothetical protein
MYATRKIPTIEVMSRTSNPANLAPTSTQQSPDDRHPRRHVLIGVVSAVLLVVSWSVSPTLGGLLTFLGSTALAIWITPGPSESYIRRQGDLLSDATRWPL